MPKAARSRASSSTHQPSAKLDKRKFAVQDNAVEVVNVGQEADTSATDIIDALNETGSMEKNTLKKKEKQQLKREAFAQRLESAQSPYSKSHLRRMRRKARELVAGGLADMHDAIAALEEHPAATETIGQHDTGHTMATDDDSKPRPKQGLIGQGKNASLSKAQRKRALKMEMLRHPLILSNPEYVANPFQTIRTHAANTLIKHQVPT